MNLGSLDVAITLLMNDTRYLDNSGPICEIYIYIYIFV